MEAAFEDLSAALANVPDHFEPQHLVKRHRSIEIFAVEIEMEKSLEHDDLPFWVWVAALKLYYIAAASVREREKEKQPWPMVIRLSTTP
jgi:hypothetical protein